MTTVTTEGKKFVTVAAVFQVNPAAIVSGTPGNFPVPHQQKAAFVAFGLYFRSVLVITFVQRCVYRSVKVSKSST
ncbi:hypothetical protein ACIP6T_17230 [Pantoea sp. NPDC088449]|uniref:hypothetical protein n=1 Tax=Pantoea sp. NPDC088449 TaxID=3364392 RepID=UPI0037FF69BB